MSPIEITKEQGSQNALEAFRDE